LEILTDLERKRVESVNRRDKGFIRQFSDWAAMKTDAPKYALEAAALQALSLAAGDTVVLPPLFGSSPIFMNLYIMMIGPSTTMRKTTVLNFVRDILPVNEMTGQGYIRFMDDVSIQAFSKEVANAGQEMAPVILNIDEIAGLFQLVRNKSGSYLAGFDKTLLKVYDHTPITIHRVGKKVENETGAFVNIFAASTPEPLLEVLDGDDVESGLLPRFIIFDVRDAIRGERRTLQDRLTNQEEWSTLRSSLQSQLADIAADRAAGLPIGDENGVRIYKRETMTFDDEAIARLDDLDAQFHKEVRFDSSAVGAIKGRAFWQIVKISGLYALARGDREVKENDVLRAMFLIETTVEDLLKMKDEVGANSLERRIIKVGELLKTNPKKTMKSTTIIRRMKLSQYEARELGGTLAMRGHISVKKDTSGGVHWTWIT